MKTDTSHLKFLYHVTDHHGFSYTIDRNALVSLRGTEVSTSTNPFISGVYGRQHYDFRFVIAAQPVIERYGAYEFDDVTIEIDRYVSLNENELRIRTKSIEPFNDYLIGTVLLFPLMSRKSIQWFMYDNKSDGNRLFPAGKSESPRAIDMLYKHSMIWRKPLWIQNGKQIRRPVSKEISLLKDMFRINNRGGDFNEALQVLCDKYHIVDHFSKTLDGSTVRRLRLSKDVYGMLNDYYDGRKYNDVDPVRVRNLLAEIFKMIGMNSNVIKMVMHEIETNGLFHQTTMPVEWGIIIKSLMYGDVDEAIEDIRFLRERNLNRKNFFDEHPERHDYTSHVGTRF